MPLPASFPTSLDALANPTATTNRDDPGFELDEVVSRIHDILEALEAKVGIGASTPGSSAAVLRRTASGTSAWAQATPGDLTGAGAGDANTVMRTTGGTTIALGKVVTDDITADAVSLLYLQNGVTSNPTVTAAAGEVTLDDATVIQTFNAGDKLLIGFMLAWISNTINAITSVRLKIGGTFVTGLHQSRAPATNVIEVMTFFHVFTVVSTGSHTIQGYWQTDTGTATGWGTDRQIFVARLMR